MIFAVYIPYNIAFGVVVGKYKRFLILHLQLGTDSTARKQNSIICGKHEKRVWTRTEFAVKNVNLLIVISP